MTGKQNMIDCHLHLFDPVRFPYAPDTHYRPAGHEIATLAQMRAVLAANGIERVLLVQPNSAYGTDNAMMLDAIAQSGGLWRGMAVVDPDIDIDHLCALKRQGVIGATCVLQNYSPEGLRRFPALIEKLVGLDMIFDVQFAGDEIFAAQSLFAGSPVRLAIDHCGRPDLSQGRDAPAFRALLDLADRAAPTTIKISGHHKFAPFPWPFEAADPFIAEILSAFTPARSVWGSDWPFLRVPERVDYSPLLPLAARYLDSDAARDQLFRRTALREFWGERD
ncbi:amidohydrolase family protein [Paracoccus sp. KR1-242]|uniref:amidohydrolase family protein n=1 Tax=Paracoccus sp. KR1-242 TaxID=3410028 RepID=UPI003C09388B